MGGHSRPRARAVLATVAGALVLGGASLAGFPAIASSATGPSEWVATGGSDTGSCTKQAPCQTINYAISVATPGETIHVEKGTYHQTVYIYKSVNLVGAGASSTIINGAGLDPSSENHFGVVEVGAANGTVTVSGFRITNPYPYAYTGGEPMAVVLEDQNSGDIVNIINDKITEGRADQNASTDFPIGVDTFLNAATTTISGDSIRGFFQGALLEDNGPARVTNDKFSSLISGTDTSSSTTYPAEGVFFLADEGGKYTGQKAEHDTFSNYSGYGIAESAGYTGGYVTPGCVANGSIGTTVAGNTFALTGGSKAWAISLEANGTGNHLAGYVTNNSGYVTSPSKPIRVRSTAVPPTPPGTDCAPYGTSNGGGGTVHVTLNNNHIAVKAASQATATSRSSVAGARSGGLHVPLHLHRKA
jgi:hypothetical protein